MGNGSGYASTERERERERGGGAIILLPKSCSFASFDSV